MHRYWETIVKPIMEIANPFAMIEIGAEEG